MDIYSLVVLFHVLGAVLGAGGSAVAEVQITRALKDGTVSKDESYLMHANYTLIRIGMVLVILSGIILILWNINIGNDWALKSPKLWIKEIMMVVIIFNAYALSKHWTPLWLGSAISLTSWWGATTIGVLNGMSYSFIQFLIGYIVAIGIVAIIISFVKKISAGH